LLFTFKIVERVRYSPDKKILYQHGDFRIFPEHLLGVVGQQCLQHDDCDNTESDQQILLEQEILDKLSGVGSKSNRTCLVNPISVESGQPDLHPPPYTAIAGRYGNTSTIQEPLGPLPLLPPPVLPHRIGGANRLKKNRATTLRVEIDINRNNEGKNYHQEVLRIVKPLNDKRRKNLPTPPSSVVSWDDVSSLTSSSNGSCPGLGDSFRYDSIREADSSYRSPSPSPSFIIDEIYCDSPTLGLEDPPVKIDPAPWSPISIVTPTANTRSEDEAEAEVEEDDKINGTEASQRDIMSPFHKFEFSLGDAASPSPSMESATSLILQHYRKQSASSELQTQQKDMPVTTHSTTVSASAIKLSPTLMLASSRSVKHACASTTGSVRESASLARSSTSITETEEERAAHETALEDSQWDVNFAIKYGVRSGEREIMPQQLSSMYVECWLMETIWTSY
jgi:hypothetical protein